MGDRFLYQDLADPTASIEALSEGVTTLWTPMYSLVGAHRPYFLYQATAQPVGDPDVLTQEPPLDSWYRPVVQPYPFRKPPTREGFFAAPSWWILSPSAPVELDKWLAYLPEPIHLRRWLEGASQLIVEPSLFTQPPLNSWLHEQSQPIFLPPPVEPGWLALPERDPPPPEEVNLDQWFVEPNQPPRAAPRAVLEGLSVGPTEPIVPPPAPEMDSWFVQASEPVRQGPPPVAEGSVVAPEQHPIPVDPTTPGAATYIALYAYEQGGKQYLIVEDAEGSIYAKAFAYPQETVAAFPEDQVVALYFLQAPDGEKLLAELGDGTIVAYDL